MLAADILGDRNCRHLKSVSTPADYSDSRVISIHCLCRRRIGDRCQEALGGGLKKEFCRPGSDWWLFWWLLPTASGAL